MKIVTLIAIAIIYTLIQACHQTGASIEANKVQAVIFEQTKPLTSSAKMVPKIWVDTNLKVTELIGGGMVKSQKPYHIRIDYTDNSSSLTALEITKVDVTYDNGIVEAATKDLPLPHRIKVRKYETINSMSGGRIVKSSVNILSDVLSDAINRDESFRLEMEGFFATKIGINHSFTVDSHYTVKFKEDISPFADR